MLQCCPLRTSMATSSKGFSALITGKTASTAVLLQPLSSSSSIPSSLRLAVPARGRHMATIVAVASPDASNPATEKRPLRGIRKPRRVSPEMEDLVGAPEIPRTQALKHIWAYIKENNLQDPDNKKIIVCDEKLKKIFGGKDRVGFLEVAGLIGPHFL